MSIREAAWFDDGLVEVSCSAGERCDVGAVFVELDNIDSLTIGRPAPEVGTVLRSFFNSVRDVTEARGGYVQRSDLCAVVGVFAAPACCRSAADAALASGRELRDRLRGIPFSIGLSVATAVPGWIGAARRFEPLAIYAPISEARRLCERARRAGRPLLASQRALALASSAEMGEWR